MSPEREPAGSGIRYVDSELYVASEHHARFSWQGREYDDGELKLDDALRCRLTELEYDPEAYGRELFAAVFPEVSRLREGLREALANAQGVEHRLRLRLHLAPGLSSPVHGMLWELLFDPDRKVALGRSPDTALSRYSTVPLDPGRPANGRPRLLGLIAAPTDAERYQMAPIDRSQTRERMEHAFNALEARTDFEILEPPATPNRLREHLAGGGYHALHVFGHGLVRQRGRKSAALVLENEDGTANMVEENVLAEIFLGDRDLRLVTLIACHGGALSSNDAFSGLAARLVERGIPAVIGMCRPVTFDLGHLFTDHLYRNLARSGRVDMAVNEARQQLYLDQPKEIDWSSPILYMRLPDGLLWKADELEEPALEPTTHSMPPAVPATRPWGWFRQAALALFTAALTLVVWPAPEAEAELDLIVSRVAFTLARKQPLDRFPLHELAAVSLDEIRLPGASGSSPRRIYGSDLKRPLGMIMQAKTDEYPQATLSLQKTLIPAGLTVILEHQGSNLYRLSIDTPQTIGRPEDPDRPQAPAATLELSAAVSGSARFKMLHESWIRIESGETVTFISRSGRIDLDVAFAQLEATEMNALEINALSLQTIVETPDPESTHLDLVSTIQSGTVILGDSWFSHQLETREELRFSGMTGSINRLEPSEKGIALRLRGTFTDLEAQVPGGGARRATVLGLWLGKGPSRALLFAVIALLTALLLSAARERFRLLFFRWSRF